MVITKTIAYLSIFGALLVCSSGERVAFDAEPSASSRELLQQNRKTTQAHVKTVMLSASGDGGLELAGNYVLNVTNNGNIFSNATGAVTSTLRGGSLLTSIVYSNVACVDLAYNATGEGVGGFLTTQDDYLAMLSSGGTSFYLREAKPTPGSNLTATNGQATTVATDPNDLYLFLTYNLGAGSRQITVHYNGHPAGSPACAAAGPALSLAGAPSSNGSIIQGTLVVSPAPSPNGLGNNASANYIQTAQVLKVESLASGDLILLGAFTNATCMAYDMFAQLAGTVTRHLDLTVFILDESNQEEWASQSFSIDPENVTLAANCSQTMYQSGDCYNTLSNLLPTSRYFLWGVSGLQYPNTVPDPAYLAITFTAQSEGSCDNNVLTTYGSSSGSDYYDYSGSGQYSGLYNEYGGSGSTYYDYSQYYGSYDTAAPPFYTGSPPENQGSGSGSVGGGALPGSSGHNEASQGSGIGLGSGRGNGQGSQPGLGSGLGNGQGNNGVGSGQGTGNTWGDGQGLGQGNGMGPGLGNGQGDRQEGRNTTRTAPPPSGLFPLPTGK